MIQIWNQALINRGCVEIGITLATFHPETSPCHSEPFDRLRTGSAKNARAPRNNEILRRPAPTGLLRMTTKNMVSGWILVSSSDNPSKAVLALRSFCG